MKLKYTAIIGYKFCDKRDYLFIKIKAKNEDEAESKAQRTIDKWNEDKKIVGKFYIYEVYQNETKNKK